ncbi:twin-arginine translocase TatA/TatE family subunit [Microbacterium sp. M]|uniref:Sec-independent protein translocase subunit TatA/TatB n=1 Tax=Microbacterium sp. M TaxID=3377125 RepID=UPI00386FC647
MFGLTVEKLFVVVLIAAVLIGPHRMPQYAGRLAAVLRQLKDMTVEAKRRAEEEAGAAIVREDWQALDPRRYDPRRIIREAWQDEPAAAADPVATAAEPERPDPAEPLPPPLGRWVIAGSSAHPRRVWVAEASVPDSTLSAAAS